MKTRIKFVFLFTMIFVLLTAARSLATNLEYSLIERVLGLGGIGSVIGLIVDQIVKRLGIIPEGKSAMVVAFFNVVFMLIMIIGDFFGLGIDWKSIDTFAQALFEIATTVLGLLAMQGGAKALHEVGRETFLSNSIS